MPRPVPSRRLSRLSLRGEGAGGSSRDRRRLRRHYDAYGWPDLGWPEPRRLERFRGRWRERSSDDGDTDRNCHLRGVYVDLCPTCWSNPCSCRWVCQDGSGLEWDNYQSGTGGHDDVL